MKRSNDLASGDTAMLLGYVRAAISQIAGFELADPTADLFGHGLSSLACVKLMVAIENDLDVTLPDDFLSFETFATIDSLAAALAFCLNE